MREQAVYKTKKQTVCYIVISVKKKKKQIRGEKIKIEDSLIFKIGEFWKETIQVPR